MRGKLSICSVQMSSVLLCPHIFTQPRNLISPVFIPRVAIINYHRLGGLNNFFSQFWMLEVQDQNVSRFGFSWGFASWFVGGCFLPVTYINFPLCQNTFMASPKQSYDKMLMVRASAYELWGFRIQSLTVTILINYMNNKL